MEYLKVVVFFLLGLSMVINAGRLHFKYKKEKSTFLVDAPAAPKYFYYLVFGCFFIIFGIAIMSRIQ
jgi:hypothetical protein